MGRSGYITVTVTVSEDVDLNIDDIMDDIPTDELVDELKKRKCFNIHNLENDGSPSLDMQMKMDVINENIHKFSYEEICRIFESKKF